MAAIELTAQKRSQTGKQYCKQLRQHKKIPAALYGFQGNTALEMDENVTRQTLEGVPRHQLIPLKVTDPETGAKTEHSVIIKEVQKHVYKDILHNIDFQELDPAQPVNLRVPLKLVGEAAGVKIGGTIQRVVRSVPVSCLPKDIPSAIEVDVTEMQLNSYMRVSDVKFPESVKSTAKQDFTILTLRGRAKVAQTAAPEESAPAE